MLAQLDAHSPNNVAQPGIFRDTRPLEPMRRRRTERKTRLQFYGASISMSNVWEHFLRMVSKERTLKWLPMLWEELVRYSVDHPTSCLWDCCRVQSWTLQFLVKELENVGLPRGPTIHTTYLVLCSVRYPIVTILLLNVQGQKCHKTDFGANHTFAS